MVGKLVVKTVKFLLLLFVVGFTLSFSFWLGHRVYVSFWDLPKEVEVPSLVGEDASVADNLLKEKGLKLTIIDSKYQKKYPSNVVIRQEPPGGIMVRRGREVMAVISLGPEMVSVPNLKGQSLRQSRILLGNRKLRISKVTRVKRSFAEPGEVLAQSVSPGSKLRRGSAVRLMVNKGNEPMIKVPSFIGMKAKDAIKRANNLSMEVGTVVWEWSDIKPKGDVIRQIPNPGSMAPPRTKVDLKVSVGSKSKILDMRQTKLVFFAPKGEGLQKIRVIQVDELGENLIYEGKHAPGGKINLTVSSLGDSEVQLYYNTKLVKRIRL